MSQENPLSATSLKVALSARLTAWFGHFERWLSWLGERLNPILIKEARQALKSRQFVATFIVLLIACWIWSIVGLAWVGPGDYWSTDGPNMFVAYYAALAVPLLVIVPFGAYRSMAAERDDRTYELLSITALRSRQIISGKLAGAGLQMTVYLSAVLPCLAFTYLLRGIDIFALLLIVGWTVSASLGLSMIGLLMATLGKGKSQQGLQSIGLIIGMGYACAGLIMLTSLILEYGLPLNEREFWIVVTGFILVYLSYFAVFFLAATAQLAFPGSNRSTALRVMGVVQQAVFTGWMVCVWIMERPNGDFLLAFLLIVGLHWFVWGVFLTGEPAELSPRVKRSLP